MARRTCGRGCADCTIIVGNTTGWLDLASVLVVPRALSPPPSSSSSLSLRIHMIQPLFAPPLHFALSLSLSLLSLPLSLSRAPPFSRSPLKATMPPPQQRAPPPLSCRHGRSRRACASPGRSRAAPATFSQSDSTRRRERPTAAHRSSQRRRRATSSLTVYSECDATRLSSSWSWSLSSSSSPRGGASRGAVGAPTSDSSCTRPLQQRTQSPRPLRRRRSRGRCCTIVDDASEGRERDATDGGGE